MTDIYKKRQQELSERYGSFEFAPQINKPGYDALFDFHQTSMEAVAREIINEIPDDNCDIDYECEALCNMGLKQQLSSKYLKGEVD